MPDYEDSTRPRLPALNRMKGPFSAPAPTRCPVNKGFKVMTRLIFGWEGQAGCFKPMSIGITGTPRIMIINILNMS